MRTRRHRGLRPLGEALGRLVAEAGLKGRLAEGRVFAAWAEVVGARIAANAQPVRLARAHLVVETTSSTWACHLQLLSDPLVEKLNAAAGGTVVRRMTFRVGDPAHSGHSRDTEV